MLNKKISVLLMVLSISIILVGCLDSAKEAKEKEDESMEKEQENKEEKEQVINNVIDLIKQKKYTEAEGKLVNANYEEDGSLNALWYYSRALRNKQNDSLDNYEEELLEISSSYDGVLSDEIQDEKNTCKEMIDQESSEIKEEMIQLIKNGDYTTAAWYDIGEDSKVDFTSAFDDDDDIQYLQDYASALESLNNGKERSFYNMLIDLKVDEMSKINEAIAQELNTLKDKYSEEIEEKIKENKRVEKHHKEREKRKSKPEPSIGMTAKEVEESRWGKPDEINRTTSEYGVSEQWVYNIKGYIYLEDGIVTSIQE